MSDLIKLTKNKALEMIKEEKLPKSAILGNVLNLAKNKEFDLRLLSNLSQELDGISRNKVVKFLDALKMPGSNLNEMLDTFIRENWTKKDVIIKNEKPLIKPIKNETKRRKIKPKETVQPTIIIKKSTMK